LAVNAILFKPFDPLTLAKQIADAWAGNKSTANAREEISATE